MSKFRCIEQGGFGRTYQLSLGKEKSDAERLPIRSWMAIIRFDDPKKIFLYQNKPKFARKNEKSGEHDSSMSNFVFDNETIRDWLSLCRFRREKKSTL